MNASSCNTNTLTVLPSFYADTIITSLHFSICMLHNSLYTNNCMTLYEEVRDSEHTLSLYGRGRIQCVHVI